VGRRSQGGAKPTRHRTDHLQMLLPARSPGDTKRAVRRLPIILETGGVVSISVPTEGNLVS
jgi:hypothetical protein